MPTPSFAGASAAAVAVGQVALPVLGDYVTRGTAVLGLAGILTILLRRRPAAARHAVWSTAMAIVGVLPLLARVVPSIAVPVPHLQPASPQPVQPGRPTAAATSPNARLARSATTLVAAPTTTRRLGVPVTTPLVGDSGVRVAISPLWLAWGWMFGTLLMLSRLVAGTLIVWRRASRADRLTNPAWQARE